MNATTAPADHAIEAALLGTILSSPQQVLSDLFGVERIRPETFDRPAHRAVFEAMVEVATRGDRADAVLVASELGDDRAPAGNATAFIGSLMAQGTMPLPEEIAGYARKLKQLAVARAKFHGARDLMAAAAADNAEAMAQAEAQIATASEAAVRRRSKAERQKAVKDLVAGTGKRWRTGITDLDRMLGGGLRPGQFTGLGGWPGHGKSVAASQILRFAAGQGAKCALFTNEMEAWELDARTIANLANVPYMRLLEGGRALTDDDRNRINQAVTTLGDDFVLIEASGMSASEIAYEMQRERWDVVVIDLLNGLPNSHETKEVDKHMQILTDATRLSSCHVIACQHLSEHRNKGLEYPPLPGQSDIRQSGQIYAKSNNFVFIYLEEDEDERGEPSTNAILRVAKARGGMRGKAPLRFVPNRLRFESPMPVGAVGSAA